MFSSNRKMSTGCWSLSRDRPTNFDNLNMWAQFVHILNYVATTKQEIAEQNSCQFYTFVGLNWWTISKNVLLYQIRIKWNVLWNHAWFTVLFSSSYFVIVMVYFSVFFTFELNIEEKSRTLYATNDVTVRKKLRSERFSHGW